MREIICRAKADGDGAWVVGWYAKAVFGKFPIQPCIYPKDDAEDGHLHSVKIIPETLGLFTDQYDREDKPICEGDIVSHTDYNFPLVVKWDDGEFGLYANDTWYDRLDHYACRSCTVIGNVHDNPELMNVS